MNQEMANLAYPVFSYALGILGQLDRGDAPDFDTVQSTLRNLLRTRGESERWPEYGGDGDRFWGARYALTCWLDELFIRYTPWCDDWREKNFEFTLYEHYSIGGQEFWQQARIAQSRPGKDALEVFYLCVMLGFRGEGPPPPETVETWKDSVESQLSQNRVREWPGPQELTPELRLAPRRARDRLRQLSLAIIGILAVVIPAATAYLVSLFRN